MALFITQTSHNSALFTLPLFIYDGEKNDGTMATHCVILDRMPHSASKTVVACDWTATASSSKQRQNTVTTFLLFLVMWQLIQSSSSFS